VTSTIALVRAFAQAGRRGRPRRPRRVLDPEVVWTSDGGGRAKPPARRPLRGGARVARGVGGAAPQARPRTDRDRVSTGGSGCCSSSDRRPSRRRSRSSSRQPHHRHRLGAQPGQAGAPLTAAGPTRAGAPPPAPGWSAHERPLGGDPLVQREQPVAVARAVEAGDQPDHLPQEVHHAPMSWNSARQYRSWRTCSTSRPAARAAAALPVRVARLLPGRRSGAENHATSRSSMPGRTRRAWPGSTARAEHLAISVHCGATGCRLVTRSNAASPERERRPSGTATTTTRGGAAAGSPPRRSAASPRSRPSAGAAGRPRRAPRRRRSARPARADTCGNRAAIVRW
jgi:RNA polymerase sigma-70 factor (ECF subfamily)